MKNLDAEIREVEEKLVRLKRAKEANEKVAIEQGKIIVTSTENGDDFDLDWKCNATASQITAHTVGTIQAALKAIDSPIDAAALKLAALSSLCE